MESEINLKKISEFNKRAFLIEFTKELIESSVNIGIKQKEMSATIPSKKSKGVLIPGRRLSRMPFRLSIPEPVLPPKFQHLKPYSTEKEIDLGRLNPLIKDSFVKIIECNGADEPIVVEGNMGRKPTKIILSEDEINEIIKKFSAEAKIPVRLGINRIVAGRLILSAIISEIVSTKFTIRKMSFDVSRMKQS